MMVSQQQAMLQYQSLMGRIRSRFDVIARIRESGSGSISARETVAFHLRKVVEGVAFGCLVACENGIKQLPRDAQGQWNADNIFARLHKRDILPLPNPSKLRPASKEERDANVKHVVEGIPEKCLDVSELRAIYQRAHKWLHEENPYASRSAGEAELDASELWKDVNKVEDMLASHAIGINGEMFFCIVNDPTDGETKVFAASKAPV